MALGGFHSIAYVLKNARNAGGIRALIRAMRTKNACKTCALGMGGQKGGMVNERGSHLEFCKKSVQAMVADMQGAITPEFFETYTIAQLSAMTPRELESCGRLTFPVIAGPLDLHYKPIDWEEAIQKVSISIKEVEPNKSFYYFSGRSSNEAGFMLQLLARIRGTNNINNCSYYCHQASGVGLSSVTGSGTATVVLDDLEKCDLIFLIGCNPASNHPRLLKSLIDLRRRGGKVIVINPLREKGLCNFNVPSDWRSLLFGSKIADVYVQPHIGGDAFLLLGVIKWLIENEGIDKTFVQTHVEGFYEVLAQANENTWAKIEAQSGVPLETIAHISRMYKASKNAIFCWAMGITHVKGGVDSVRMIANVAMARGMLGKEGAGLLPLRGHSNVQGMGSVGVVPTLKGEMARAIEKELGITLPTTSGFDTMAGMKAAHGGDVDLVLCLGGNLAGSNPDTRFAMEAMSQVNQVAYLSTTLNQGHFIGRGAQTIIFPVLARDEEPQVTTQESMFNYVRRSSGGSPRHSGPKSEIEVIVSLAKKGVGKIDWEPYKDNDSIRALIATCLQGFDATREHQIAGRTFHTPLFSTPNGKAKAHRIELQELPNDGLFSLMTIRSEGQFNTVVYEEQDIYRGQTRRDIVMMHEEDAQDLGVKQNDEVIVRGPSGDMRVVVRCIDITKGNCAMYYPEVNQILSTSVDIESRTPLFKGERVEILSAVHTL
ncbi:MAG: histidine kinase [Phycisphaerae bacterium]|nr:histidine kinase [Phycisphaerae bacterium]|tara:strand:- start:6099 stop:8240 length:2142 start_codon:yes stop_codon:yes gene_type:complete